MAIPVIDFSSIPINRSSLLSSAMSGFLSGRKAQADFNAQQLRNRLLKGQADIQPQMLAAQLRSAQLAPQLTREQIAAARELHAYNLRSRPMQLRSLAQKAQADTASNLMKQKELSHYDELMEAKLEAAKQNAAAAGRTDIEKKINAVQKATKKYGTDAWQTKITKMDLANVGAQKGGRGITFQPPGGGVLQIGGAGAAAQQPNLAAQLLGIAPQVPPTVPVPQGLRQEAALQTGVSPESQLKAGTTFYKTDPLTGETVIGTTGSRGAITTAQRRAAAEHEVRILKKNIFDFAKPYMSYKAGDIRYQSDLLAYGKATGVRKQQLADKLSKYLASIQLKQNAAAASAFQLTGGQPTEKILQEQHRTMFPSSQFPAGEEAGHAWMRKLFQDVPPEIAQRAAQIVTDINTRASNAAARATFTGSRIPLTAKKVTGSTRGKIR